MVQAVVAVIHPSATGLYLMVSLLFAAALGAKVGKRPEYLGSLLTGYLAGITISALALLESASGLSNVAAVAQPVGGYTGLSFRSTAFSYEAALGLVIWWSRRPSARSKLQWGWIGQGVVIASALLASGGRGGLVACIVGFFLLPLAAGETGRVARFVAYAGAAAVVMSALGVSALSIERLRPAPINTERLDQDQYGSGRLDIYRTSLREAGNHPFIGGGYEVASLTGLQGSGGGQASAGTAGASIGQASGHNVLLALLLSGGLMLAVAGVLVLGKAAIDGWTVARRSASFLWVASGIAVFLVRGLFESDGGLFGAQNVLLFSALCTSAATARSSDAAASHAGSQR